MMGDSPLVLEDGVIPKLYRDGERHLRPEKEALEKAVPLAVLRGEIAEWAARIGVEPKEVHIRPMTRKWASCSTHGRLTFDMGLISLPADFRARVIVHELVHLKVPNHGKAFKTLVKTHLWAH